MLVTSVMYDVGDILDRGSLDKLYFHVWDAIDIFRNLLVGLWLVYRVTATGEDSHHAGRAFLVYISYDIHLDIYTLWYTIDIYTLVT